MSITVERANFSADDGRLRPLLRRTAVALTERRLPAGRRDFDVQEAGGVTAEDSKAHNQPYSALFTLPPLSIIAFRSEHEPAVAAVAVE